MLGKGTGIMEFYCVKNFEDIYDSVDDNFLSDGVAEVLYGISSVQRAAILIF